MVAYIRSDLEFILKQIELAEAHAAGTPLYGAPNALIPTYNLAWGLRTVDGSYNHLLNPTLGAADHPFPELLDPSYRPAEGTPLDMNGPAPEGVVPTAPNYNPSNSPNNIVLDPSLRTISNLIVDQTLDNPAAIMIALERAGAEPLPNETSLLGLALQIKTEYQLVKPLFIDVEDTHRANVEAQRALEAAQKAVDDNDEVVNPDLELTLLQRRDAAALVADGTQADSDAANLALTNARAPLDLLLEANGVELQGINVTLTNVAPDEGLSAPFNSWFTLFGQFFDHGLDLVSKGGSGTVFIPLAQDDPLYDPTSPTNFMVLTRATTSPGPDGIFGDNPATLNVNEGADDIKPQNLTTSFVDQNQTYTSHPSHQVFLREYAIGADGKPHATGALLDGANGGLPTWAEVKEQARTILGIDLTDYHVGNLPLLATDLYGNFIPNPNAGPSQGFPQVIMAGNPPTMASGTPAAPLALVQVLPDDASDTDTLPQVTHLAVRTGHAFLDDIAHTAAPVGKIADGDTEIGLGNPGNGSTEYDNELLDSHFITGDGRGNENIGLTAVHHVFHSEHNRLLEHTKSVVLATNDITFINEWLDVPIASVPANLATLDWNGERLFQAAKFGTEMQYQHLVFEEFARKIQPNINVFLVPDGYDVTLDPSIVAEFAHVVYRFGHSMLTETIDRFDPAFNDGSIGLIEGFLNPIEFATLDADEMAGSIIRGMTRQAGNEIDEFVTSALRNNLLGLPLDLATINLARGRDTGVPSLNEARRTFYEAANQDSLLKPYESWVDFAAHLKNEASIINFVAAYGTHTLITTAVTLQEKRDAALTIITGQSFGGFTIDPQDRLDFLNATGDYAADGLRGGLENIDLWIGGLAEQTMPFGGMLGSTFNFVFEGMMEKLQSGDRFYYLQRLDGLHLFGEMENNSFSAMIMKNTDATHLPSDVFSNPGLILEIDRKKQYNPGLGETAGADLILEDDPLTTGIDESADNLGNDPTGGSLLTPLVVRNNPATPGDDTNYLRYTGDEHVVLGGTDGSDVLIASIGDDTLYGDGGNDRMEGGFGNDIINAGDGDDIVVDSGGDDNIKAGKGHDVVHAGPGLDLVMGNDGQDFIFLGTDMGSEVFAGTGNDFIYGNKNAERILGNEGDDWIETGTFDGAPGDNFDEVFSHDGIDGNDVFLGDGGFDEFIGEGGDDIFVGSPGRGKMVGMSGFDWANYKDNASFVNADLSIPIIFDEAPTLPQNAALDEYESVEGLSGTKFNDVLKGSNTLAEERLPVNPTNPAVSGTEGYQGSFLDAQGIALINGLQGVLGAGVTFFNAGDIILGGDGSDRIQGNAGDDIIDGDKWLNVRIGIMSGFNENGPTGAERTFELVNGAAQEIKSMTSPVTLRLNAAGAEVATGGTLVTKPLSAWMFEGRFNPGQLQIIREIKADATPGNDTDTAVFQGARSEYAFSATADGQVIVTHAIENALDGTDRLRNIEKVEFADGGALNVIVGTPYNDNGVAPVGAAPLNQPVLNGTATDDLILGLAGADLLNGLGGNDILVGGPGSNTGSYTDNFNSSNFGNSDGATNWGPDWDETGDGGDSATAGQIQIDNGTDALRFLPGDGAQIQRSLDLAGATSATLTYSLSANVGLEADDTVTIFFSRDGIEANFVQVDQITLGTATGNKNVALTGPFTANAAIRLVASSLEAGENVNIDSLSVAFVNPALNTGSDTLNGGDGDDTYSFTVGDGNDIINEAGNDGLLDRISILAPNAIDPVTGLPVIDPATDLPVPTLTSLNAADNNTGTENGDLVITYGLPTGASTSVTQQITVVNHFDGNVAETGVERINFNGATVHGYLLGATDYVISRADPANRTDPINGVNLSASTVNNFVVGEEGVNDDITGGLGNDLIFGGTGDNALDGGAGDDLLVGGSGTGDNDVLDGGLDADTMVGLGGNDTYIVDDVADVVVEAAGAGTDTVETLMAALSIEAMANVENLSYEGADADQFVGTGNSGNNNISGGDLADTLSGLAGNDTLEGGLDNDTLIGGLGNDSLEGGAGADSMTGGDGDDVYFVDDAGDVVNETGTTGTDRVESDVSYVLGIGVENLDLNNNAPNGTGNDLANIINGNGAANQILGGGGNDTLNGADGNDVIDGGLGNDSISSGNDNDTVIGGAGDDTIDVGGGFNNVVYSAANFGADVVNSFDLDPNGGGQDRIDLSGLGITTGNFAARVTMATVAGPAGVMVTVDGGTAGTGGTIRVNGATLATLTQADFILAAAPATTINGTDAAQTINGTVAAQTINALGGNDTVNAGGGNDVVNGGEGADTLNGDDGNDTLSGGVGSTRDAYADDFSTQAYNNSTGGVPWTTAWIEASDVAANPATSGAIQIIGGNTDNLRFGGVTNDANGASLTRGIDLTGATNAVLTYSANPDNLDGNENLTVWFAANGVTFVQIDTVTGNNAVNRSIPLTGAVGANSAIRFTVTGVNNTNEIISVDDVAVTFTAATNNGGSDVVNGGAGDDTVIWNASPSGLTDGRDVVDGGTEGGLGDTFVINGRTGAETYNIYTRAAWQALGNSLTGFNDATEIVVARNGLTNADVIAELREIEEIRINSVDPSGPTGSAGGDTFNIVGDFSGTSLRLNTITIDGDAGDDTIDISSLQSAHRIVFKSNGGHDTIIGTLRSQDVIELPEGANPDDYEVTENGNGTKTLASPTHSVTFTGEVPNYGGPPSNDEEDEDEDEDDHHDNDEDEDEDDHEQSCGNNNNDDEDENDDVGPPATQSGAPIVAQDGDQVLQGTAQGETILAFGSDDKAVFAQGGDDVVKTGAGNDYVEGKEGADMVFAGAGNDTVLGGEGRDMLYGEAGDDHLFGDGGDDLIDAGAGNDAVYGGAGNDTFVASAGDGNDTYYGDDMAGGYGSDTLDMAAISANVTANLGANGGTGSASSSQSGNDVLRGVENIVTGSGDDRITAGSAANIMDAGGGSDTFVFLSASDANGDTILGFEPGDKIDLSAIDANAETGGNDAFTLTNGANFSGPAQLVISHETRADGDYTVVSGNVSGADAAEFSISIKGTHDLKATDFVS